MVDEELLLVSDHQRLSRQGLDNRDPAKRSRPLRTAIGLIIVQLSVAEKRSLDNKGNKENME